MKKGDTMLRYASKRELKCVGKTVYTRQLVCPIEDKVYWACTPGIGFKCTFLDFIGDRHAAVRLERDGRTYETHMGYLGFNPAVTVGIGNWKPCDQIIVDTLAGKDSLRYVYQTILPKRRRF